MKHIFLAMGLLVTLPQSGMAQSISFGDDSSEWSNDNECDDRRFYGAGMANGLDEDDIGKDRTDCKRGFDMGELKVWDFVQARAATQCDKVNYGDNSSEWAGDGECDDYRFEGPGSDGVQLREDIGKDAKDCRALCDAGKIALRDY
ncbi:hypothetical protein GGR95_000157 [Sulfitobacter undariae]|uniref:Uncharacterized protein n=1 Tax=Sulfitobacter undariae TaxID=1563671 RepID=A0A7W6GZF8_9RHOB|nr:hypothetical protein [Sulfitobacter undariae]MBB3992538.1 hypothetical protein [Sulfitobacter undariae]